MAQFKGHLVLVVGPSGAGKDSVLRGAMAELAGDKRFVFPRRFVTRFADARAEDHQTLGEDDFVTAQKSGAFALSWQAHGNSYGIGRSIDTDLEAGCIVAINCSRAVLAEAADKYPHVTVAEISAPAEVLVARIVSRGRETADQAMARVARKVPDFPMGIPVVRIVNDGPVESAVDHFCDMLERLQLSVSQHAPHPHEDEREEAIGDDNGLAA